MRQKSANPFYVGLVVAGSAFAITACAYGVMMLRLRDPALASPGDSGLISWLDRHGMTLLMAELAVLAVCTVGAMATEDWWQGKKG